MEEYITKQQGTSKEITAREFAKQFRRMCDSYDVDGRNECDGCKLCEESICNLYELDNVIPIVEKWAKEHPEKKRKTYAEDFLEKMPNSRIKTGVPLTCRGNAYGKPQLCMAMTDNDCISCWNEEMEAEK